MLRLPDRIGDHVDGLLELSREAEQGRVHIEIDRQIGHRAESFQQRKALAKHVVAGGKVLVMGLGPAAEEKRQSIIERIQKNQPASLEGTRVARYDTLDGYRFTLADNSWLLIRFSGTEPLLRIYAETGSRERVEKLLDAGQEITGV